MRSGVLLWNLSVRKGVHDVLNHPDSPGADRSGLATRRGSCWTAGAIPSAVRRGCRRAGCGEGPEQARRGAWAVAISVKTLRRFCDQETARQLRGLMTGTIDPETFASVQAWRDQCYSWPPSDYEMVMCAVDQLLGGSGVEVIRGRYVDHYSQDIQASYVNMGDTYDLTVLYDHETERYVLTSCGDWVERNERKRELV